MRSIDPNLLTWNISFDFCSVKNIIHHCGINIDKKNKNFKECNKQFCSWTKKILMIGKKSYSNTAVVFVLLGFNFFLVFFENFFEQTASCCGFA
jgi:hypothetical protein